MIRVAYTVLVSVVVWVGLVPVTLIDIVRRRASWMDLRQRLGAAPPPNSHGRRIVVHAVSAGEATAAIAVIRQIGRLDPQARFIATCGTEDARGVFRAFAIDDPSLEAIVLLPWDRRRPLRRWIDRVAPDAVVVVEPEIWPNLYAACRRRAVPLLLANAHIYPRDLRRYRMIRPLIAPALQAAAWIGAQTESDRAAFIALGAPPDRVMVAGNMKFDAAGADPLRLHGVDPARTILAGSVHAREIEQVLDAVVELRAHRPDLRGIVAPRYLRDAERAADAASRRGLRAARWSDGERHSTSSDVLIVDRFGVLASLYASAEVAIVGGSFVDRGGHNVLEPAAQGCAVVVGPHVDHIAAIVSELAAVGGIVQLDAASTTALTAALRELLHDESRRRRLGNTARSYQREGAGAAMRAAEQLIASVR
jgi:3-deoxy-D-manno-octulosonic-acid transferase